MMKKIMAAAVALLMSGTVTTAAQAAMVTQSFQVNSTFDSGPMELVRSSFDLTFDNSPTISTAQSVTMANFKSDGGAPFTNATGYTIYFPRGSFGNGPAFRQFMIGGNNNPSAIASRTNDFRISMEIDDNGKVLSVGTIYTVANNDQFFLSSSAGATSIATAAVPEPATWAMMALGFGLVAGAARYRRRSTNIVYA